MGHLYLVKCQDITNVFGMFSAEIFLKYDIHILNVFLVSFQCLSPKILDA